MGINKREEGKKVNSNINVTPMVDVMLVLLIIFMVITPMLNNKVNVDLPTADFSHGDGKRKQGRCNRRGGYARRKNISRRRPDDD